MDQRARKIAPPLSALYAREISSCCDDQGVEVPPKKHINQLKNTCQQSYPGKHVQRPIVLRKQPVQKQRSIFQYWVNQENIPVFSQQVEESYNQEYEDSTIAYWIIGKRNNSNYESEVETD